VRRSHRFETVKKMKQAIQCCAGLVFGLSLYGCGGAGDLDATGEETIGSLEEALSSPIFEHAKVTSTTTATLDCPDDKPWLLGTAAEASANTSLKTVVPVSGFPTGLFVDSGMTGAAATAEGVCSNAMGIRFTESSSTGQKVASCPSGMVAVGGGGECEGSGRLFRSRPSPDTDGSKPTGWAAACTSGPVIARAICVWEDMNFDFTSCRTERVDGVGTATVSCPANRTAVSAGGYCGNNTPLFHLDLNSSLTTAKAACRGFSSNVHAYAVCCD
jgi:hypothetical protein